MKNIYISDVWGLTNPKHENYEFVNVALNKDNLLFIDPCLIESWDSDWAKRAMKTINSFFGQFYTAYNNDDILLKHSLLNHAKEQNATRLGYGSGYNGKGNTAAGLIHIFKPLEMLIHEIDSIGRPQDLTVLIPGFAEDGFSDLLTNILHSELNNFTLEQMQKYNIKPNSTVSFYTWDYTIANWVKKETGCYRYGKNEILLVPKKIVRKKYLFSIGQYFQRVILERKRTEDDWFDENGRAIPKKNIAKQLKTNDEHWQYKFAIDYTKKHSDALQEYHKNLQSYYVEFGQPIEDDMLDEILLGVDIEIA